MTYSESMNCQSMFVKAMKMIDPGSSFCQPMLHEEKLENNYCVVVSFTSAITSREYQSFLSFTAFEAYLFGVYFDYVRHLGETKDEHLNKITNEFQMIKSSLYAHFQTMDETGNTTSKYEKNLRKFVSVGV